MPACAWAVDWSVKSTASQTVEANDNLYMRSMLAGGTLGSYSTVTANAEARTPTSKLDFDSDVNYRKYWGGTEGLPLTENLSYGFRGHYETSGKTSGDRQYVDASFHQQSTSFALLGDLGLLTNTVGMLDTLAVGGGIDRALSARDTLNLSAHSTRTSYEPSAGGTAFQDTSANAIWRHRLFSTLSFSVSSEAQWLSYDNATRTNTLILRNQAGIDITLSPVLSLRGNAGAALIQSSQGAAVGSANLASSSSQIGFLADMLLTYRILKNTTLTLSGSHSTGPSVVGSLSTRTIIGVGASHIINSESSLSFSADISRQESTSTTDFASAGVSYSYQLAREWNAQLSYRHLHRFATKGTAVFDPVTGTPVVAGTSPADSNSIIAVISKSFTVLAHTD